MMCLIKTGPDGTITGWMIGVDSHDMRRRAGRVMDSDLAAMFYRLEFPISGKHEIAPGMTLLVD